MRARDILPLAIIAPLALFVAALVIEAPARLPPVPPGDRGATLPGGGTTQGAFALPASDAAAVRADATARRAALEATRSDAYLAMLIDEGERVLTRWPDAEPVAVWVAPRSSLRGWHPRMVAAAREAFDRWRGVAGVQFRFVEDSANAAVIVNWRDRFAEGRTVGHARRHFDGGGWIRKAEVELAIHGPDEQVLSPELVRAAALHEVGHVLGLPHSDQPDDIMAPAHAGSIIHLSLRDESTAGLLYGMRPGPLGAR